MSKQAEGSARPADLLRSGCFSGVAGELHAVRSRAPHAESPECGPSQALCVLGLWHGGGESPRDRLRLERGFKDIVCSVCESRVPLWDLIEEKFASPEFIERVRLMEEQAKAVIDNESRELILVGHAYAIAGEAGQIYRQYTNSDHGIDGEIEFKDRQRKGEREAGLSPAQVGRFLSYKRKRDRRRGLPGEEPALVRLLAEAGLSRHAGHPDFRRHDPLDGGVRLPERESQGGEERPSSRSSSTASRSRP